MYPWDVDYVSDNEETDTVSLLPIPTFSINPALPWVGAFEGELVYKVCSFTDSGLCFTNLLSRSLQPFSVAVRLLMTKVCRSHLVGSPTKCRVASLGLPWLGVLLK